MFKELKADWCPPLKEFEISFQDRLLYWYPKWYIYPLKGELGSFEMITWYTCES